LFSRELKLFAPVVLTKPSSTETTIPISYRGLELEWQPGEFEPEACGRAGCDARSRPRWPSSEHFPSDPVVHSPQALQLLVEEPLNTFVDWELEGRNVKVSRVSVARLNQVQPAKAARPVIDSVS